MRIPCPHCGARDLQEFAYLGDVRLRARPETPAGIEPDGEQLAIWHDYVYLRDNPAGEHDELWFHASGCRQWLVVRRDLRSHAISDVTPARPSQERARHE